MEYSQREAKNKQEEFGAEHSWCELGFYNEMIYK